MLNGVADGSFDGKPRHSHMPRARRLVCYNPNGITPVPAKTLGWTACIARGSASAIDKTARSPPFLRVMKR
jgi:hypothetical protein